MIEALEKWFCNECGEIAFEHLSAPNPFDPEDTISGCPNCKEVNALIQACHHLGCNQPASGGYPSTLGYRYAWLCYKHSFMQGETK